MVTTWQFAGRSGELARIRALVADPAAAGLVITGPAGVGKSALAAAALREVAAPVVRVTATEAAREVPYGAFGHVLPDRPPSGRLVLLVDDAHLLDTASAALLHRLAADGRAFLLATSDAARPWPGDLPRMELGPLSAAEVAEIADDPGLYRLSGGHPLLLRELLEAGLPEAADLDTLITRRLDGLSSQVRRLAELVAYGEPVGAGVLAVLEPPGVLAAAAASGVLTSVDAGRRAYVRLAHPRYGEVLRAATTPERAAALRLELAAATEKIGARRREDPLRMAVWRLDSGAAGAPGPLVTACRLAWAAHDVPLAIRLGEAAVQAGGGVEAAVALANVLMNANRQEEGEAVLLAVWDRALDERERVLLTTVRAGLLFGMDRVEDAGRLLEEHEYAVKDRALRHELRVARGNLVTLAGQCRSGRAIMESLLAEPDLAPAVAAQARTFRALALAHSGRSTEALEEAAAVDRALEAWRDEAPFLHPVLALTRYAACVFHGDLPGANQAVAEVTARPGALEDWPPAVILFRAAQAHLARLAGRLTEAREIAELPVQDSASPGRHLMPCLAERAMAAALSGDTAAARAALSAADEHPASFFGLLRHRTDLARAWVVAGAPDPGGASRRRGVELALVAAARARAESLYGYELAALHDVVRLGAPERAAERLAELTGLVDGVWAGVCTAHARALLAGDAAGLEGAAAEFERLGVPLPAAETLAEAAALHAAAGAGAAALTAAVRAWALAERCEGARLPGLELTGPERDVARLLVEGLAEGEIAERLGGGGRTALAAIHGKIAKLADQMPAKARLTSSAASTP